MENKEKKSKKLGIFIFGVIIVLSIVMISAIISELNCDGTVEEMNALLAEDVAVNNVELYGTIEVNRGIGHLLPTIPIIIGILVAVLLIIKFVKNNDAKKSKLKLFVWIGIVALITWVSYTFIEVLTMTVDKPVIYLYPEEEIEVNVKLGNEENITCSYPKYKTEGWNVIAKPNGDLIDLDTNRKLYSLYWEGINTVKSKMNEGFVIKGEDTAKFLEEKLEILGLNYKETEEFIIYWLPKLENNKYNFIRFQTEEEINQNMPLEITPVPDTVIRVVMEWKGLNKYVEIPQQKLATPERNGFTVVEWGGTEVK